MEKLACLECGALFEPLFSERRCSVECRKVALKAVRKAASKRYYQKNKQKALEYAKAYIKRRRLDPEYKEAKRARGRAYMRERRQDPAYNVEALLKKRRGAS